MIYKNMSKKNKQLKLMECKSLEDFKHKYIRFKKQEMALEHNCSYFNVETSNMDGTFIGEQFDNAIRMKFIVENNKKFVEQVNLDELNKSAKVMFDEDFKKRNMVIF